MIFFFAFFFQSLSSEKWKNLQKIFISILTLYQTRMTSQINHIWNQCLSFIKDNVSDPEFNTWFKPIVPISIDSDKTLTIKVPTPFFIEWLEEHYLGLLSATLTRFLGNSPKLKYITGLNKNEDTAKFTQESTLKQSAKKTPPPYNPYVLPGIVEVEIDPKLNKSKGFETFISGESNKTAYNASLAIANNPGITSFNPLFIFGGVGLGKTHLAHAIGLKVQENFPNKKVLYIETENFTKQFIDATKRGQINDFIHFYQQVDVLLVDNIQFLSSKAKTQDAFFHIFSELHSNGKQIVLTSDKAPSSIPDVEERLLSRFKWGISTELARPELALRKKIFQQILQKNDIQISEEITDFVVSEVGTNIRELEGVCNSLVGEAILVKNEITLELAKNVINRVVSHKKKNVTIEDIENIVSEYFNISVKDILSQKRPRNITQARHLTMFFAKKYTKNTLKEIGKRMNRGHSSIINGCRTVENLKNTEFKQFIKDIELKIKQ